MSGRVRGGRGDSLRGLAQFKRQTEFPKGACSTKKEVLPKEGVVNAKTVLRGRVASEGRGERGTACRWGRGPKGVGP